MTSLPSITGVAEIVLSVVDLPKMREFYTAVLGFGLHSEVSLETEEPDPDGEPTITFLTITELDSPLGRGGHGQILALIDYQRHVYARHRFTGHNPATSTLNHLAFEILDETHDDNATRLEELGIAVTRAEFPRMKARALFFSDPEQNTLELISHYSGNV